DYCSETNSYPTGLGTLVPKRVSLADLSTCASREDLAQAEQVLSTGTPDQIEQAIERVSTIRYYGRGAGPSIEEKRVLIMISHPPGNTVWFFGFTPDEIEEV